MIIGFDFRQWSLASLLVGWWLTGWCLDKWCHNYRYVTFMGTHIQYVAKNRIACEHPDIVSAAISVGGPLEVSTNDLPWYFRVDPLQNPWLFTTLFAQVLCNNSSAVPVMHWHGTLDPLFPWCLIIIFLITTLCSTYDEHDTFDGDQDFNRYGVSLLPY